MEGVDLLVLASSTFRNKDLLFETLDGLKTPVECIYSIGETCHEWLEEYCKDRGLVFVTNFAKYYKDGVYDDKAGFNNKYQTIKAVDNLLVFWDEKSKGTLKSLEMARRLNKKAKIITFKDDLDQFYFFSGPNHPLSIDYPVKLNVKGHEFVSARHLFTWWAASKKDKDSALKVLGLDVTKKNFGTKLKELCQEFMLGAGNPDLEKGLFLINRTKFAKKELREFLVQTEGDIVFCGPPPLGIGLKKTDKDLGSKDLWGPNLLGRALSKLRKDLRKDG